MILDARVLNQELATRFDRWLRIQEYSAETNDGYLRSVVSLCRFIGDQPVTISMSGTSWPRSRSVK